MAVASSLYFFFHTLIIVPYLAALSEIVTDEQSRVRVASWQTVFNTAGYVLTYVVAPILFEHFGIRGTIWMLVPVFISFIGPILVIRESSTLENAPESKEKAADVPLWQSVKLTLKNKTFRIYMISVATFYFGLQFSWVGSLSWLRI